VRTSPTKNKKLEKQKLAKDETHLDRRNRSSSSKQTRMASRTVWPTASVPVDAAEWIQCSSQRSARGIRRLSETTTKIAIFNDVSVCCQSSSVTSSQVWQLWLVNSVYTSAGRVPAVIASVVRLAGLKTAGYWHTHVLSCRPLYRYSTFECY